MYILKTTGRYDFIKNPLSSNMPVHSFPQKARGWRYSHHLCLAIEGRICLIYGLLLRGTRRLQEATDVVEWRGFYSLPQTNERVSLSFFYLFLDLPFCSSRSLSISLFNLDSSSLKKKKKDFEKLLYETTLCSRQKTTPCYSTEGGKRIVLWFLKGHYSSCVLGV